MGGVELRPLSLGEILDRTFSLYRQNFLLFIGLSGLPQMLILGFNLAQLWNKGKGFELGIFVSLLLMAIVYLFAYLFAQGGAIVAVSDLYLGRASTITGVLSRVWGELLPLFGVLLLNGLVIMGGLILLVIPGVYLMCRLLVCVPVALIEKRGPRDSLSRSFDLTRDNAGRAFVIFVLALVITFAASFLFVFPFGLALVWVAKNPDSMRIWGILTQVASSAAEVLSRPVLLIATSIFYYDLRVRKEAFDLQFMLDPEARPIQSTGLPSILS